MVKKNPKYSKRINYDALAGLLAGPLGVDVDKDKDADAEMAIVDEDARDYTPPGARVAAPRAATEDVGKEPFELPEEDEDEADDGKDDFGADGGWEDAFEQEA
jgi:hypothetical protein